jgi:hypothetical protein
MIMRKKVMIYFTQALAVIIDYVADPAANLENKGTLSCILLNINVLMEL